MKTCDLDEVDYEVSKIRPDLVKTVGELYAGKIIGLYDCDFFTIHEAVKSGVERTRRSGRCYAKTRCEFYEMYHGAIGVYYSDDGDGSGDVRPEVILSSYNTYSSESSATEYKISILGSKNRVVEIVKLAKETLKPHAADRSNFVTWKYISESGVHTANVPLKKYSMPVNDVFYPFISSKYGSVSDFVSGFFSDNERSSVLILNGPPGTGKSSLIRYMIEKFKRKTITTYDEKVMNEDSFYADFLGEDDVDLLVLEDADRLLMDRKSKENDVMSKILNVAEGILNLSDKKIIFTSNIQNMKDIDEAILRPGRCYANVEFRELNHVEADAARDFIGKPKFSIPRNRSLAEVFCL